MNVTEQIQAYIDSQPETKRIDMEALHLIFQQQMPECRLWFLDGKNDEGKVVSNPNIGYGSYTLQYANGTSREFYRIGLSANTTGISVYVMGLNDKNYLKETFGKTIGKASVSGYCIKFKTLRDIQLETLKAVILHRMKQTN